MVGVTGLGDVLKAPAMYGATVTFGTTDLNLSLNYFNWWSKGRCHNSYYSTLYSSCGWYEGIGFDKSLELSVTYTIPYGKKVSRDDELKRSGDIGSAVLK